MVGVGDFNNKANSVQLQLQLPTENELGNVIFLDEGGLVAKISSP